MPRLSGLIEFCGVSCPTRFSDGKSVEDEGCGFDATGVTQAVENGVVLEIPVAGFPFRMLERDEA